MLPLAAHLEAGVLGSSPLSTRLATLDQPHQGCGSPISSRAVVWAQSDNGVRKAAHKLHQDKGRRGSRAAPPSGRGPGPSSLRTGPGALRRVPLRGDRARPAWELGHLGRSPHPRPSPPRTTTHFRGTHLPDGGRTLIPGPSTTPLLCPASSPPSSLFWFLQSKPLPHITQGVLRASLSHTPSARSLAFLRQRSGISDFRNLTPQTSGTSHRQPFLGRALRAAWGHCPAAPGPAEHEVTGAEPWSCPRGAAGAPGSACVALAGPWSRASPPAPGKWAQYSSLVASGEER